MLVNFYETQIDRFVTYCGSEGTRELRHGGIEVLLSHEVPADILQYCVFGKQKIWLNFVKFRHSSELSFYRFAGNKDSERLITYWYSLSSHSSLIILVQPGIIRSL